MKSYKPVRYIGTPYFPESFQRTAMTKAYLEYVYIDDLSEYLPIEHIQELIQDNLEDVLAESIKL